MSEIELKPCPFCGSKAILIPIHFKYKKIINSYAIGCAKEYGFCEINPSTNYHETKEEAIAAWNRRYEF